VSDYKKYSELQQTNVHRLLESIIKSKLPNKKFIKHDGYKIISLAQIARLSKSYNRDYKHFEHLIKAAEAIDNQSDQVFVLTILAEIISGLNLKSRQSVYAKELVGKALSLLEGLECKIEFINRVDDISKVIRKVDPSQWKPKIKEALTLTIDMSNMEGVDKRQKAIIDSVYRIDKRFAESLIELFDKDEARKEHAGSIKKRLDFFKIKEKISDSKANTILKDSEQRFVTRACIQLLSELNSDVIASKPPHELRWLLKHASKMPLLESAIIYQYYFQNLVKRYEKGLEREELVKDSFDSLLSLCQLLKELSSDYKSDDKGFPKNSTTTIRSGGVFKPGNEEESRQFVLKWLLSNVKGYVKIGDPYFEEQDLDIIKELMELDKSMSIEILTSQEGRVDKDLEKTFIDHWKNISSQEPPRTVITVATSRKLGKSAFHDRYILTEGSGLRFGTSLKEYGKGKISEISIMEDNEAYNVERNVIDKITSREVLDVDGDRIRYKTFELD